MASVLVLISSYNGENYIREQLQSLISQKGVETRILIRDDGSCDRTLDIIKEFQRNNKIRLVTGKNIGYAASFMTLVHMASEEKVDYYAFCDQDDVWENDKLKIAISHLKGHELEPALYLSQAKIVDSNLNPIAASFHKRKVDLGAVLEHNFAIGCTMVFNQKLRDYLDIDLKSMCLTCGHDSWVFLVALAIESYIYFDAEGHVLYRQHGTNASGKIVSAKQAIKAIKKILITWKHARSKTAEKLLTSYNERIDNQNAMLLNNAAYYMSSTKKKSALLNDYRMHSDYFMVDVLFKIAVILNLF